MKIDGILQTDTTLNSDEFVRVVKLSPEERFDYFLQSLSQTPHFWGLYGENGWVMVESDGDLCLPIWPNDAFVVSWEREDFPKCEPKQILLNDFLAFWAAGLVKNNTLVLLFPCGEEEEGIVMAADEFAACITESSNP
ncbi:DUF2750 domain-containing protein [Alteromonas oceanisediminis]|uniref:DUF2750 domain-containing protein n=1 Tax=Alteromonas oceanisediminis TaxID=2836180 RepID=UPI001BDB06E9|nr:DUF2750 domain-containing protein [Alteromonas oceanisediminis]MBT0587258.1 DUF2750 domain-containing protein [Alteromonas oceanisediminis]